MKKYRYTKKIKEIEYDLNLKEQYPEIYLQRFVPMFYNLALASISLNIMSKGLRKAGLIKRSYYKRNKKYWRKHI